MEVKLTYWSASNWLPVPAMSICWLCSVFVNLCETSWRGFSRDDRRLRGFLFGAGEIFRAMLQVSGLVALSWECQARQDLVWVVLSAGI